MLTTPARHRWRALLAAASIEAVAALGTTDRAIDVLSFVIALGAAFAVGLLARRRIAIPLAALMAVPAAVAGGFGSSETSTAGTILLDVIPVAGLVMAALAGSLAAGLRARIHPDRGSRRGPV